MPPGLTSETDRQKEDHVRILRIEITGRTTARGWPRRDSANLCASRPASQWLVLSQTRRRIRILQFDDADAAMVRAAILDARGAHVTVMGPISRGAAPGGATPPRRW